MHRSRALLVSVCALLVMALCPNLFAAATIAPYYSSNYTITDLGQIPSVPDPFGGLNFVAGNYNLLLLGGDANQSGGLFYAVPVTRGAGNHITGFGSPSVFGTAGAYNDGGLAYGPGGVLFYTRYPTNEVGEIKPGSTSDDKIVDLSALGIASSTGALNFVPPGFGGAGHLKISSWSGGEWYDVTFAPDGSGTYNLTSATYINSYPGGPEGFIYVPHGSPLFPGDNLLMAEYSAGTVGAYQVDANGDPILGSRQDFILGLDGAEGAFIDPITGDFLFSTFISGSEIYEVRGFAPTVPEPSSLLLLGTGALSLAGIVGRKLNR
ncbi:MAG TPA: PEP-CTERM sorting domain-containing protein [Candidatus Bathyarchaeia archaeon]|nr:PEP-CTERM sorting domain-containing protein [Candidatus Bathyarchaeia archaeon]